ncbi:helix-turn-helix transcriptional regulator [Dongia mobilis]|uniref:helix-turn-helix transcriptional regulator n=1 Tax=Dongia mobilis TaxID=578943 RepID=UPI00105C8419|nr:helix-turn-helix transcriptional regulator [Dongia mobilis]
MLGEEAFGPVLLRSVRRLIDFDFIMAFAYQGDARPLALGDTLPEASREVVIRAYCAAPYVLDPFYQRVAAGVQQGCYRLRDIAPDRFRQSEYFRSHYRLTGIREEVGFYFPIDISRKAGSLTGAPMTGVLSFARWESAPALGRGDMDLLLALAPAVGGLCARHYGAVLQADQAEVQRGRDAAQVKAAYQEFGAGHLSERERQIVSLILQGHSTGSVAHLLDISPGTVKVHRKNIYRKLNLSTQAELFAAFLSFVG